MTPRILRSWRWPLAALLGLAAVSLRIALTPWLDGLQPFVFAYPAVALGALLGGFRPALLTLAVCAAGPLLPGLHFADAGVPPGNSELVFVLSGLAVAAPCAWVARRLAAGAFGSLDEGTAPASTGRDTESWLRALMGLALLLPALLFAAVAWQSRQAAFANAEERVERSAVIAREHALKIMNMDRLLLDAMHARFDGMSDAAIMADQAALQQSLALQSKGLPDVLSIAVWDRQGRPLLISRPQDVPQAADVSQREDFAVQRAADRGLYVSRPVPIPGAPGQMQVIVSERRSPGAEGGFAGTYAIALRAEVFHDFYRDLLRNENSGSVALFRPDGAFIARTPETGNAMLGTPSATIMAHMAAGDAHGLVDGVSPVDGKRRLAAFRRVEGYPLYVGASIQHEAVIAPWVRDLAMLAAFTFPTAIGLAWVSWLAVQQTRRERMALDRWRGETVKRAQAEDALRQTQRLEALGHLTGGVAHDVNNLLMVVSNNAYLLRRLLGRNGEAVEAKLDKPLDAILRAVTTGARLTRQLLAFARRQALRPELIRLQDRMDTLVDLMRHSVSSTIAVEGRAAADTGLVLVDPAELELALINLAVNARDAMPQGGRITVEARNALPHEHEGLGTWVSIAVRDTGVGMPPEVLDRVFEPFFTTKEQGKGTGLGLSQVYGFCQQAGGVARIQSRPGEGTLVQLVLPAGSGTPQPADEAPPMPSAEGRLLLVEDNAEVAEATEPMLSSWGYAVRSARSGDAAKELLQQAVGGFELLLTDIVMPGSTDGLSLARHVRQLYPSIGIVLMTGHARETDKAMAEGFVVLQKPWTPPALAAALEEAHPRKRVSA
jgi:two-component system NtrC family sensor kinase